jgi:hypothetical protein
MILETYHAEQRLNGSWIKTTEHEEFDNREELDKKLMIYKIATNLGYRVYDCSWSTYANDANKDRYIVDEFWDKAAVVDKKEK